MSQTGLLAVVDVGSNSFRLEIVRAKAQGFVTVRYLKQTLQQGASLQADGSLSAQAMQDGWDCLAGFGQCLRQFHVRHVRAVATQTLRQASNQQVFLERASQLLGYPLELISGEEEARLMYLGVASRLPASQARRLVMDIGGRSTEWALGQGGQAQLLASFAVGSAGWSQAFFPEGVLTPQAYQVAVAAAGECFASQLHQFQSLGWDEIYVSAGTVNAVCEVLPAHGKSTDLIAWEDVQWLRSQLLAAERMQDLRLPGLRAERRPMLAGGLAVLEALFTQLPAQQMQRSLGALRTGVLCDLALRLGLV